jgi:hypothetical protein
VLKPLPSEINGVTVIKDLGIKVTPNGYKIRYALFECKLCNKHFKKGVADARRRGFFKCKRCAEQNNPAILKRKHGLRNTKIYKAWNNMKNRCFNKKVSVYKSYGGRGITVCDEWRNDVRLFYKWSLENGYKENLTIDRINNDGNYEPSNCRWVDMSIQAQNTRKLRKNNTLGYRGVAINHTKFQAQICVNMKTIYLGNYDTVLEAAIARDTYVIENNLHHALNNILFSYI